MEGGAVHVVDREGNRPAHGNQRWYDAETGRVVQKGLSQVAALGWPTPRSNATRGSRKALVENRQWSAPSLEQTVELSEGVLPRGYENAEELHGSASARGHTPRSEGFKAGRHHGNADSLHSQMKGLLASPRNSDAIGIGRHGDGGLDLRIQTALWSTPAAQDGKNATLPPSLARRDTLVGDVMRLWHSPSTGDGEGGHTSVAGTSPAGRRPDGSKTNTTLANDLQQIGAPGVLNPDWVEILMGYGVGWTDIDAATPATHPGWPMPPGVAQHPYEPPRTVASKTVKHRNKRLKTLGNAVVPQQAAPLFAAISQFESAARGEDS